MQNLKCLKLVLAVRQEKTDVILSYLGAYGKSLSKTLI